MRLATDTILASCVPPIWWVSPYGRTITSPLSAQSGSPPSTLIQHRPSAMTWKRITRSEPGARIAAASFAGMDS
jgi:hypothetical protein